MPFNIIILVAFEILGEFCILLVPAIDIDKNQVENISSLIVPHTKRCLRVNCTPNQISGQLF